MKPNPTLNEGIAEDAAVKWPEVHCRLAPVITQVLVCL